MHAKYILLVPNLDEARYLKLQGPKDQEHPQKRDVPGCTSKDWYTFFHCLFSLLFNSSFTFWDGVHQRVLSEHLNFFLTGQFKWKKTVIAQKLTRHGWYIKTYLDQQVLIRLLILVFADRQLDVSYLRHMDRMCFETIHTYIYIWSEILKSQSTTIPS